MRSPGGGGVVYGEIDNFPGGGGEDFCVSTVRACDRTSSLNGGGEVEISWCNSWRVVGADILILGNFFFFFFFFWRSEAKL